MVLRVVVLNLFRERLGVKWMGIGKFTDDLSRLKKCAQQLEKDIGKSILDTGKVDEKRLADCEARFETLCCEYEILHKSVFKWGSFWLVWHILLDAGRFLKIFFPQSTDYWLIERVLIRDEKKIKDHQDLVEMQALLENMSRMLSQINVQLDDSRSRINNIDNFLLWFKEVFDQLSISPFLSILSFLDIKATFGFSNFTVTIVELLLEAIPWTIACYACMKTYGSSWHSFKRSISPGRIDWARFMRGFLYMALFMIGIFAQVLLTTPIAVIWYQWLIAACITVAFIFVQTLTEEIIFRRPILRQENGRGVIFRVIIMSMIFALVHVLNPEFLVITGLLGKLAFLSSFFAMGFYWGVLACCSGGIELSWGLHFASNLFLCIIVGYIPSPLKTIPLITLNRVSTFSQFSKVSTVRQVALIWLSQMIVWGKRFFGIYLFELFFRPKYYVSPVNSCRVPESRDSCSTSKKSGASSKESTQRTSWFSFWKSEGSHNNSPGVQACSSQ